VLDKVAVIGYSGHGYVVTESAISVGMIVSHYCDKSPNIINPFQLEYLGFEGDEHFKAWGRKFHFILGVGDNKLRHEIGGEIRRRSEVILNVIDPSASLSKYIEMGSGNFIAKHAIVNTLASLGDFCILNTGCIIEHECTLQSGVHIAPGAVLAGNVQVGENTFIGANSVVKQGVKIGKNVIIGAGSVIINDILDNQKVVGNPGRIL
jgi:sugar O-acyltransferase (sialic acid O-acetyltransferase NeuD family)